MGADISTIKTADSLSCESPAKDNMSRDKMFNEAWWLQYCCCRGVAIGDFANPLFAEEGKMLCLHSTCEMVEIGGPYCQTNLVNICITSQCQFPPAENSPTCVCFNKKLAGNEPSGKWTQKLFEFENKWEENFWIYYFLCAGCSVHKPNMPKEKTERPLFALVQKQLCIKRQVNLVQPISGDGNLCSSVGTALCLWTQCQFPPAKKDEGSPFIACCGVKLENKDKGGKPLAYGKPKQEEMQ